MEEKRFATKKEWKQLYKDYYNSLDGWGIIGDTYDIEMDKDDETITTGDIKYLITLSPYNETDVKVMRSLVANGKDIIMQLNDKNKDLIMYIFNSCFKNMDVFERVNFLHDIGIDVNIYKTNNDADPNYEINTAIANFMTKGDMRMDYVVTYRIAKDYIDFSTFIEYRYDYVELQKPKIVYESRSIDGFIRDYLNSI